MEYLILGFVATLSLLSIVFLGAFALLLVQKSSNLVELSVSTEKTEL